MFTLVSALLSMVSWWCNYLLKQVKHSKYFKANFKQTEEVSPARHLCYLITYY